LKEREETWRLRSREIWLQARDDNTKLLQNFTKGRKVANTIWKLPLPDGGVADTFKKLSMVGTSHFQNIYKFPQEINLVDIIQVVSYFSRFVGDGGQRRLIHL